jgi:hypothetical protein
MNSLEAYLQNHYQTADQLAAVCSISTDELAALVSEKLVPHASYTIVDGDKLISQAFGEIHVPDSTPGQYYHPGNAIWIELALEAKERLGPEQAQRKLKKRFKSNFAAALEELDKTTYRLSDSFTDTGHVLSDGLNLRTESAWDSFLNGIFSLCVADPSSEKSIARKEILQEALTELTDSGSGADFSAGSRCRILELIDQYAQAAMPFSPPEYPRSSRKRLVEDLTLQLAAS